MRKSITVLQSAQRLRGMKEQLTPEDVMEVAGVHKHDNTHTIFKHGTDRHTHTHLPFVSLPPCHPPPRLLFFQVIPPSRISGLLVACKSNSFRPLQTAAQEMIFSGFPVDAILQQFLSSIMEDETIGDVAKAKIAVRIAENEHKLIEAADEYLQLLDVLAFTARMIATP